MNDSDSGPCTFHLWQKSPEWAWFSTVSAWSLNAPKSEIAHHFAKFRYTREWTIYTVYGKTDIHGLLAPAKLCLTYRPRADRTRTCPSTSSCFPWVRVISPVSLTEIIFSVSLLYSSHLCRDQNSLGQRGSYSSLCIVCIAKEEPASSLSWWGLDHTTAIETLTIWSDQNCFSLNLKILSFGILNHLSS